MITEFKEVSSSKNRFLDLLANTTYKCSSTEELFFIALTTKSKVSYLYLTDWEWVSRQDLLKWSVALGRLNIAHKRSGWSIILGNGSRIHFMNTHNSDRLRGHHFKAFIYNKGRNTDDRSNDQYA